MPKLTVLQILNSKGKCRLADGGGLYFDVTPFGLKRWIYRFRIDGKGNMFVIGHYPEMSLEQARQGHREAKALVKEGANLTEYSNNKWCLVFHTAWYSRNRFSTSNNHICGIVALWLYVLRRH